MKKAGFRFPEKYIFLAVLLVSGTFFLSPAYGFDEPPLPLFQDDSVLKITIEAPLSDLIKAAKSGKDEFPAALILHEGGGDQAFAIKLSPRGISRRTLGICAFPPLKADFRKKQVDGTLFHGQNKLKLVTHCQKSGRYQDYYIKEYAIYRALNVVTPISLKVRLAEITYIDSNGKRDPETKYGFFIEDVDDLAERHGMAELNIDKIGRNDLEPRQAAIYGVFQYLIGNLDWSNIRGPEGEDCCHNTKLIAKGGAAGAGAVYPVPYDFDFSGLVDTPYAVPPENVSAVRNVRQRLYRGYCAHNEYLGEVIALFTEHEGRLREVFGEEKLLSEGEKKKTDKYLDDFFETLRDPDKAKRALNGKCVN